VIEVEVNVEKTKYTWYVHASSSECRMKSQRSYKILSKVWQGSDIWKRHLEMNRLRADEVLVTVRPRDCVYPFDV